MYHEIHIKPSGDDHLGHLLRKQNESTVDLADPVTRNSMSDAVYGTAMTYDCH